MNEWILLIISLIISTPINYLIYRAGNDKSVAKRSGIIESIIYWVVSTWAIFWLLSKIFGI
jgi:hypothetical protein